MGNLKAALLVSTIISGACPASALANAKPVAAAWSPLVQGQAAPVTQVPPPSGADGVPSPVEAGRDQGARPTPASPAALPAADPQAADSADIVVTGIRASLESAARIKRDLNLVADGISAEDIGRFPDQNLAESLQRITGVQITRDRGEGARINVRGLSSSFTRTQYNGRTVGSSGGRAFDFRALSAEFVSSVEVYKSPTADLIDGGLAGTLNIHVARPLEVGKTRATITAEGVYEPNSGKVVPRVAALTNYVTKDGSFGANLGVGYEVRELYSTNFTGYGGETGTEATRSPPLDYNLDGDTNDRYTFAHAQSFQALPARRERLSVVAGLQARPSDGFEAYADLLYSRFIAKQSAYSNQTRFTNIAPRQPGAPFGVRGSVIDTSFNDRLLPGSQGFLTTFDADGVDQRGDQPLSYSRTSIASGAVGFKAGQGPFKVSAEGSYSESSTFDFSRSFNLIARASVQLSLPNGLGAIPTLDYKRGYDPLNGANYNLVSLSVSESRTSDENLEGRVDLSYEFDGRFPLKLRAGGFASNRQFIATGASVSPNGAQLAAISGGAFVAVPGVEGASGAINAGPFTRTYAIKAAVPGMPASILVPDSDAFFSRLPLDRILAAYPLASQLTSGFDVTEASKAAYAMVDFGGSGSFVSGNIGVRYVNTTVTSTGYAPDLNNIIIEPGGVQTTIPAAGLASTRSRYSYFLPSLNVKFALTDNLVARTAVARVLGRPDLGQLAAGTTASANVRTITSGNPRLRPYLSDQVDVSLEYYFSKGGVISAAAFYKKLSNYILTDQQLETYTAQLRTGGTQTLEFRRSFPVNYAELKIKGVELSAQMPLSFLPSPFDGFGVMASGTFLDVPKEVFNSQGIRTGIDGVSKYSYNAGGYYEKGKFGLRLAYNYRSRFIGGQSNYFGDGANTRAYGQLDGSLNIDLNRVVSITADITNITNAKLQTENDFGLLRLIQNDGRRITAGVRVKL